MHVYSDEFWHTCGYLCNHQQNQDTECFLHLQKVPLYLVSVSHHCLWPKPPAIRFWSLEMRLTILEFYMSRVVVCAVCLPLLSTVFSLCYSVYQWSIPFVLLSSLPLRGRIGFSVHWQWAYHRQTLEILQVLFRITTIKWVSPSSVTWRLTLSCTLVCNK